MSLAATSTTSSTISSATSYTFGPTFSSAIGSTFGATFGSVVGATKAAHTHVAMDAHLPYLPSSSKSQASRTANTSSQVYEHAGSKTENQAEIKGSTTTRMSESQAETRAGSARGPPQESPWALENQAGTCVYAWLFEQTRPLQPMEPVEPVEPVEPEIRAAIRVTGSTRVPAVPSVMEIRGGLETSCPEFGRGGCLSFSFQVCIAH